MKFYVDICELFLGFKCAFQIQRRKMVDTKNDIERFFKYQFLEII